MKRFIKIIRTTRAFPFILALVLVLSLAGGTVLANTFLGWPDDGTFRVAVNQQGNIRLLSPDINGEHNDELKKNEFLIELPSRELVAMLENLLSELEIAISGLESDVGGQQGIINSLQSTISSLQSIISGLENEVGGQLDTISSLQSAIGGLESRLSVLESGDPGGGDPGGDDPGGDDPGGGDPGDSDPGDGDPGGGIVTDGLILWYPMDEGGGSIAHDNSGFGNDGVITGATWEQSTSGLWYLDFDGSDDIINGGDFLTLGEHTILWWMKSSHATGNGGVFGFRGGSNGEGLSIVGTVPYLIMRWMGNRVVFDDVASYLDGEWHFWVLYIAGSGQSDIDNATLTIDGNTIAHDTVRKTDAPNPWDGNLLISGNGGFGRFDSGMGDFLVYTRALTTPESTNLRLATQGRYQ